MLIYFEISEADNIYWHIIDTFYDPVGIAFIKSNARNCRQYLDPERRHTHSDHLIRFKKEIGRKLLNSKAKIFKHGNNFGSILRANSDPDIHITSRTRITVIRNSITTNQ